MKRSEVNAAIQAAEEFFTHHRFSLPSFARWSCDDWSRQNRSIKDLRKRQLGWDVTDFGSGDFHKIGLTLFTLRNALPDPGVHYGSYAEKIMFVEEGQLTPLHFHHRKTEDIINRGGNRTGDLIVKVYNSTRTDDLADTPVDLLCDGIWKRLDPGGEIVLRAGESVTLTPRIYHAFHAVNGPCLAGEVSTHNNDSDDNRFFDSLPRFSTIVEDTPPLRLLCTEYPPANNSESGAQFKI